MSSTRRDLGRFFKNESVRVSYKHKVILFILQRFVSGVKNLGREIFWGNVKTVVLETLGVYLFYICFKLGVSYVLLVGSE